MARTACLVCFISTVNGRSKKEKKKKPWKTGASSRYTTNLKQSILETFHIYGLACLPCFVSLVLLVAAAKILAVKVGTTIGQVCLPALSACKPCLCLQKAFLLFEVVFLQTNMS
jgi:hypothetical protein